MKDGNSRDPEKGFLALNRYPQEGVTIILENGDAMEVVVSKVEGRKVTLRFKAGRQHRILRTELIQPILPPGEEEGDGE